MALTPADYAPIIEAQDHWIAPEIVIPLVLIFIFIPALVIVLTGEWRKCFRKNPLNFDAGDHA